jgi:uncharacterized protein YceH (UPF0502 family)
MHLLCGAVDTAAISERLSLRGEAESSSPSLEARVAALENEVAMLREEIATLRG